MNLFKNGYIQKNGYLYNANDLIGENIKTIYIIGFIFIWLVITFLIYSSFIKNMENSN
jgi:hypothetical protein